MHGGSVGVQPRMVGLRDTFGHFAIEVSSFGATGLSAWYPDGLACHSPPIHNPAK